MIAYVDSSVLIRILLSTPNRLPEWDFLPFAVASELLAVECYRTLDQLWHRGELTDEDLAEKRPRLMAFLQRVNIQPLDRHVLDLASEPLPTSLATLDAIHLATARIYRAGQPDERLLFATHDKQLAKAATALHFDVIGVAA